MVRRCIETCFCCVVLFCFFGQQAMKTQKCDNTNIILTKNKISGIDFFKKRTANETKMWMAVIIIFSWILVDFGYALGRLRSAFEPY